MMYFCAWAVRRRTEYSGANLEPADTNRILHMTFVVIRMNIRL